MSTTKKGVAGTTGVGPTGKTTADYEQMRDKYLRKSMWPTIFCTGCGHGSVLDYTFWALEELALDMDRVVFVSGIGCSSRLPGYINADGLHTTHGRAIAFATGVKSANPDLTVIVFTGDGDCSGIGGNHFLHGVRRNIDITVIAVNNFIYGMTGGQLAPSTPRGAITTTSPYGNVENPFNMAEIAMVGGASYVARWPVSHPYQPIKSIKDGIKKKGFAFIEMLSPCPTAFGRRNKLGDVQKLWDWYDEQCMYKEDYDKVMAYGTPEEREKTKDKITIGVLQDIEKPEFTTEYAKVVERLRSQKGGGGSAEEY
jgi:2-oxoglutarate ferredoxin oxidoreductase subunit beta